MKLIVPLKMVPNPAIPVSLQPHDKTAWQPDVARLPLVINPFDEIALELGVQLREAHLADALIVLSIGPESWEAEMRTALALGADRAIRIEQEHTVSPLTVARAISTVARNEDAQGLLFGRQGVDEDQGSVGPMTAALLGWGQATFVSQLQIQNGVVHVTREVDGGLEQRKIPLPAVITTDLRLNTPRYASLPNIMKARRKPLERIPAQSLAIPWEEKPNILSCQPPPTRPAMRPVPTAEALVALLKSKGFLS